MVAAIDASPVTNHGKGGSLRTTKGQAPMIADVDHALLLVVLAKTWVSLALHRKRSLLHARHLFASSPGRRKQPNVVGLATERYPNRFYSRVKAATNIAHCVRSYMRLGDTPCPRS